MGTPFDPLAVGLGYSRVGTTLELFAILELSPKPMCSSFLPVS